MSVLVAITHDGRHDPRRCGSLRALLLQLDGLDSVDRVIVVDGGTDGPRPAAIRTLREADRVWTTERRLLLLQDDVVLAPDAGERLIDISRLPYEVVFGFSTRVGPGGWVIEPLSRPVSGGVCSVLTRSAVRRALAREDDTHRTCTERVLLESGGGDDATVWPSIGQHRWELESYHRQTPARSPSYDAWYPPHGFAEPVSECPYGAAG